MPRHVLEATPDFVALAQRALDAPPAELVPMEEQDIVGLERALAIVEQGPDAVERTRWTHWLRMFAGNGYREHVLCKLARRWMTLREHPFTEPPDEDPDACLR